MLQWSAGRSSLKVVDDQISVPTYTDDIVSATLTAISRNLHGLYHLTNSGYAPRNEVAKLFFDTLEREIEIIPVSSNEFPSPVKRPMFSAMSNHKLANAADIEIPSWQDAVIRYCRTLQHSNLK
jgi:dTDP-4-dehydrorhamnose reductase